MVSGSVVTVHRVDGKLSEQDAESWPGQGWSKDVLSLPCLRSGQDAGIAAALDTGMSSQQLVSVVTTDTVSASSCV